MQQLYRINLSYSFCCLLAETCSFLNSMRGYSITFVSQLHLKKNYTVIQAEHESQTSGKMETLFSLYIYLSNILLTKQTS
jgi:hypothetical protein